MPTAIRGEVGFWKVMSTPSTLLLFAGAGASLAGVWTLAGLSESSGMRSTPRVVAATAVGLLGEAALYSWAPAELRSELSLPLLFGTASVLALAVGVAKLEAALSDRDGPRVVRRAAGLLVGTVFGMAAVGAASLDLNASSLTHARLGWTLMFALMASLMVAFAERARYAGAAFVALGQWAWVLAAVGAALLTGARLTATAASTHAPVSTFLTIPTTRLDQSAAAVVAVTDASPSPSPTRSTPPAGSIVVASTSATPEVSTVPFGRPGEVVVEAVTTRGLLEADARGGVGRRNDRLQACVADPKNQQTGALSLRIGIDPSGSVSYSKAIGGDLAGTPLAGCLLPVFYKMGFAAPASNSAGFEITLRVASQ